MKSQEKKYLVDSFAKIQNVLDKTGARKSPEVITTHYYAPQKNNDVVKLVQFFDRNEIHVLKESQGTYSLTELIPVANTDAGLQWLKDKGYGVVNLVKMLHTNYEYKSGVVGLYIIDDFLYSIILDFPKGQHESIAKEFGLDTAEVICVPYNKLLEQMGRLRSMRFP